MRIFEYILHLHLKFALPANEAVLKDNTNVIASEARQSYYVSNQ